MRRFTLILTEPQYAKLVAALGRAQITGDRHGTIEEVPPTCSMGECTLTADDWAHRPAPECLIDGIPCSAPQDHHEFVP